MESEALFVVVLPRRGCARRRMTPVCAAHKHSSLIPCCGGFLVPVSQAQRGEERRVKVRYRVSARRALGVAVIGAVGAPMLTAAAG